METNATQETEMARYEVYRVSIRSAGLAARAAIYDTTTGRRVKLYGGTPNARAFAEKKCAELNDAYHPASEYGPSIPVGTAVYVGLKGHPGVVADVKFGAPGMIAVLHPGSGIPTAYEERMVMAREDLPIERDRAANDATIRDLVTPTYENQPHFDYPVDGCQCSDCVICREDIEADRMHDLRETR